MSDFIWDSKKPKIALKTLQMSKPFGRAYLVNFQQKDDSLKASWVKTIEFDEFLKACEFQTLNTEMGGKPGNVT